MKLYSDIFQTLCDEPVINCNNEVSKRYMFFKSCFTKYTFLALADIVSFLNTTFSW